MSKLPILVLNTPTPSLPLTPRYKTRATVQRFLLSSVQLTADNTDSCHSVCQSPCLPILPPTSLGHIGGEPLIAKRRLMDHFAVGEGNKGITDSQFVLPLLPFHVLVSSFTLCLLLTTYYTVTVVVVDVLGVKMLTGSPGWRKQQQTTRTGDSW